MLEGVRRGGYNKTEESEITMQEEEGTTRVKRGRGDVCGTTRAALMACGNTDQNSESGGK